MRASHLCRKAADLFGQRGGLAFQSFDALLQVGNGRRCFAGPERVDKHQTQFVLATPPHAGGEGFPLLRNVELEFVRDRASGRHVDARALSGEIADNTAEIGLSVVEENSGLRRLLAA